MTYRWACSTCGEEHVGLPLSWGFDEPAYWHDVPEADRQARGYCDSDICVMTDDAGDWARFVRGIIEIPIADPLDPDGDAFLIGVWASLSETNFDRLVGIRKREETAEDEWFGWLSNEIPVYGNTLGLPTTVRLREPDLRPIVEIEPGDHPLARDQAGITFERAVELAEQWYHRVF
jgi:hypothetical protein